MSKKSRMIFATNNQHKVNEIKHILGDSFHINSLKDAGIHIDIPEPHDTLEANATEKSTVIYALTGIDCFSEDTGLEVTALHGAPGVKSARYAAGESFKDNNHKLLFSLEGQSNRTAQFRTIISLIFNGKEFLFEGICKGNILTEKKGSEGFGYDPLFVPDGAEKTFAEMTIDEKSMYSHRKKATEKLIEFLRTQHGQS
ncbi:MAG: RdgB/HAM1 family non-canonical purine NTP pyrophosphatase [Ferruginibacter sp.]